MAFLHCLETAVINQKKVALVMLLQLFIHLEVFYRMQISFMQKNIMICVLYVEKNEHRIQFIVIL